MKVYVKFITISFLKSFMYVFFITLCLVFILNILNEIEFFKNLNVKSHYPFYLSLLNTPALIFEMFPFIFLISTQIFFINLFYNNQIHIFKYSGLKNSKILVILSLVSFFIGVLTIFVFYNFSSNLKNIYLEIKNKYSVDNKYLAVITQNGLWIKDTLEDNINIVNASKIEKNFLIDVFITQFNNDFEVLRNIKSEKVDIKSNIWTAYNASVYEGNASIEKDLLRINSNFDYQKIQSLFSNLSALSMWELFELKKNYKLIGYSTTEIDLQLHKVFSYPFYLTLMTILSAIIMFNTKNIKGSTLKISIGLFLSVIIYYVNNFFGVMGKTEKLSLINSIWVPLIILTLINLKLVNKINEK
jgi:lipopolysaccharide export system permease protein